MLLAFFLFLAELRRFLVYLTPLWEAFPFPTAFSFLKNEYISHAVRVRR